MATGQRCANNNLSEQGGAEQQQMEWSSVLISSSWGRYSAEAGGRRSVSPSPKEVWRSCFELEVEVGSRAVNKPSQSLMVPGCLSAKIITDGPFG